MVNTVYWSFCYFRTQQNCQMWIDFILGTLKLVTGLSNTHIPGGLILEVFVLDKVNTNMTVSTEIFADAIIAFAILAWNGAHI